MSWRSASVNLDRFESERYKTGYADGLHIKAYSAIEKAVNEELEPYNLYLDWEENGGLTGKFYNTCELLRRYEENGEVHSERVTSFDIYPRNDAELFVDLGFKNYVDYWIRKWLREAIKILNIKVSKEYTFAIELEDLLLKKWTYANMGFDSTFYGDDVYKVTLINRLGKEKSYEFDKLKFINEYLEKEDGVREFYIKLLEQQSVFD